MKFTPEVEAGFQSQHTYERYSAALYTALAYGLDTHNLTGAASYFHKRAGEEVEHAQKFAGFLADIGIVPKFDALNAVSIIPMTIREAVEAALVHEKTMTARLEALYFLADNAEAPTACVFVHPYLTEQVEEERTLEEWLTRLSLTPIDYLVDSAMGAA